MKTFKKLCLILSLSLLVSCSKPPDPTPFTLNIGVFSSWMTSAIMFLAQEQGFFAKQGIQVHLLPVNDYQELVELYRKGTIDVSFMILTDAIVFEYEGIPTRLIYITDHSEGADVIMAQPNFNNLSELKGKKISIEGFNTFSHLLVLKLLEQAGISEGDFQVSTVRTNHVLDALESHQIDAGHIYNPHISKALDHGYKVVANTDSILYLMAEGFAANAQVVQEHPQEIQKLVAALIETIAWWQRFPEESIRIIAKVGGVSEAELQETAHHLRVLNLAENKKLFEPSSTLFKGGKEIGDFLYQKGVLSKIPDLNTIIDAQFINAISQ